MIMKFVMLLLCSAVCSAIDPVPTRGFASCYDFNANDPRERVHKLADPISIEVSTQNFTNIEKYKLDSIIIEMVVQDGDAMHDIPIAIIDKDNAVDYNRRLILNNTPIYTGDIILLAKMIPHSRLASLIKAFDKVGTIVGPISSLLTQNVWVDMFLELKNLDKTNKMRVFQANIPLMGETGNEIFFLVPSNQRQEWNKNCTKTHFTINDRLARVSSCPGDPELPMLMNELPRIQILYYYSK